VNGHALKAQVLKQYPVRLLVNRSRFAEQIASTPVNFISYARERSYSRGAIFVQNFAGTRLDKLIRHSAQVDEIRQSHDTKSNV
jgi:hypothetical protein